MRTLTLVLLVAACGPADGDDTAPTGPEPGCLRAPGQISMVNRDSGRPMSRPLSLSNDCVVDVDVELSVVDAPDVTVDEGLGPHTIAAGDGVTLQVTYQASEPGSTAGQLVVTPDADELEPLVVAVTAESPGPRWSIGVLIDTALVRECPGEMQIRFENVGEGSGVRPKARVAATDAEVTLTSRVLPEEGAANLTARPVVLHAVEAELVVTVEDDFAGDSSKTFTLEADDDAEREELFAAGPTGPVSLESAPIEASIEVEVDGALVEGWSLSGRDITLPDSVDRTTQAVIVRYVPASACG